MSRIYFHSQNDDGGSELSGAERAYMGYMINGLAWAALGWSFPDDPLLKLVPKSHYLHTVQRDRLLQSAETWFSVSGLGGEQGFIVDGKPISNWRTALNTAMVIGNDAIKLMARLHGQCEIHCWVSGQNRAWLASIMQQGLDLGIYRKTLAIEGRAYPLGWEAVIEHLRKRDTEPVVCSYSVCEQFPNSGMCGWKDENDGDDWYELPEHERWERAMAVLKEAPLMELRPDNFSKYHFGEGITVFDLRDAAAKLDDADTNPTKGPTPLRKDVRRE